MFIPKVELNLNLKEQQNFFLRFHEFFFQTKSTLSVCLLYGYRGEKEYFTHYVT